MVWLPDVKKSLLMRLAASVEYRRIPACDGQTDGWTDILASHGKNRDFRPTSRYISQTIQDSAIVTMEGE